MDEKRPRRMNTDIDKRKTPEENSFGVFSDSHRIQTCNLLIRSQMLYSVELGSRFLRLAFPRLRVQS